MEEVLNFDFLFWAGLFAVVSPLIISLLKNLGFIWPSWLKALIAAVMAVLGTFFAVGMSMGWETIDLASTDTWKLVLGAGVPLFAAQYAFYMAMWKPDFNGLETWAAKLGQPHN